MNILIVYGIKNCDTVKKALTWLKENKIDYNFHDYKSKGITEGKLKQWSKQVGWESLLNKKGMTWRQLDEKTKNRVVNEASAFSLMIEKTSVIKRPLIERDGKVVTLGFDSENYDSLFNQ